MTTKATLIIAISLLTMACSKTSLLEPTPVSLPTPQVSNNQTWIVSGQSNAVNCGSIPIGIPFDGCTTVAWEPAAELVGNVTLKGWAKGSSPISLWDVGNEGWTALTAEMANAQQVTTFLWWQGETDAVIGTSDYASRLTDLIARVRQMLGPVRMVIIGLLDSPVADQMGYARIRAAQRAVVAADNNAIFIDTQGIPTDPLHPYHLTEENYRIVGARIASIWREVKP